MWVNDAVKAIAPYFPKSVKSAAKRWLFKGRHPAHLGLRGTGVVQDLYYWVSDGRLDTFVPIQNYFSAFYPMLDTKTSATLTLFDNVGRLIGRKEFAVGHLACVTVRLSRLLTEFESGVSLQPSFGTLLCNMAVPVSVQATISRSTPFYFWDRFYIGYLNRANHPAFVHGVDKTFIYRAGEAEPIRWYSPAHEYQWAPEIPININEYERFSVIVLNRVSRPKRVRLILEDRDDRRRDWEALIEPNGVHRFELTPANTEGLEPAELRMRLEGMSTQWGRPVVFKEFSSGAISVMHC
jgi:hypothetical protein